MGINLIFETPADTQAQAVAQYDQAMDLLGLRKTPAAGGISHCAGPIPGGWRVCDVWESQAQFDAFMGGRLVPVLLKVGIPQPVITIYPVVKFYKASQLTAVQGTVQKTAVNAVFEIPGGTQAQYEQTLQLLGIDKKPQKGQISHAGGPMPGGWRVVDTWESKDVMDAFFKERLGAVLHQIGWQPIPRFYPVHRYLLASEVSN